MPRLKVEVQIRKETALEALRDALRSAGRSIRPRLGCKGYSAVSAAMSHWLGVEFSTVTEKERLATLRAATQWESERSGKPGPHARVDREAHGTLLATLASLLASDDGAPSGGARATRKRKRVAASSNAHDALHPGCRHRAHIAAHGAVPVNHLRPGDSKPHVDFVLPDGTLDCRFDPLDGSLDGVFSDEFCDKLLASCGCEDAPVFDPNVPGAFAQAGFPLVRHGDHAHLFGADDVVASECGLLWPAAFGDDELPLAHTLLDCALGEFDDAPPPCGSHRWAPIAAAPARRCDGGAGGGAPDHDHDHDHEAAPEHPPREPLARAREIGRAHV